MTADLFQACCVALAVLGVIFFIGSLDDLILDVVHLAKGLRPRRIELGTWARWKALPEQPIAIMIPAWKEHSVLEAMVRTNLKRLRYRNYRFFVGVYPNDIETLTIAKALEVKYPTLVTVVVTDRPGPTSKAHCLNNILRVIEESTSVAKRDGQGWIPRWVAIHDAEDVIHPLALTAINAQASTTDFIQVPIFSLPVPLHAWVAGTYLDEFAEIHLKEIPVREALGMPVPSAGVGTFFSWRIMEQVGHRFGYWFDENNLTEDYEISLRMARLGAQQQFLLIRDEGGEIVATREYFPDVLGRSVRQKTRWTTGIGLQTWSRWNWFGMRVPNLREIPAAYALWRDRKSLWSNPVSVLGWLVLFVTGILVYGYGYILPGYWGHSLMVRIFAMNVAMLGLRLVQRARFSSVVYGPLHGILSLPRLILSTFINAMASLLAIRNYTISVIARQGQKPIRWDKTDHKFPELLTPEDGAGENETIH
jgi:adsorption protein B